MTVTKEPVIIDAVRTPVGRNRGALRNIRPDELYAGLIGEILKRTGIAGEMIDDVITGSVTQYGEQGANISRLAVLLSPLPPSVPAVTLNRMCGSSQQAVHFAAQSIAAGDAGYVLAGGVESMTRVPMFSDIGGGLENLNPDVGSKYELIHQGESAERIAEKYGLTREELDRFSFESHSKAARAIRSGFFKDQIMPVAGADAEGKPFILDYDEGVRLKPDLERMSSLAPAFRAGGVITAANSSQISDGAALLLIADRERAEADGLRPRAKIRARAVLGGDPTMQLLEVIPATAKVLTKAGLSLADMGVIEINEAFASVVLAWSRELKPDMGKVNPNGGAIAHGHPLGATGAVLMTKLLYELERMDGQFGLQVMCIGHGMATATIIERL
ncbi:MAG: acetyl-CoA acetyltransferase [Candidatus Dadabacteria bacterium RIFCSPHIGHO2_12_FULL_53_21]|nr:MAG: acetyl-CoA acetyltransferase [Candidatus Dadabacteria bacterium RIFCSPHIGHO2_12_FULL_53_21]